MTGRRRAVRLAVRLAALVAGTALGLGLVEGVGRLVPPPPLSASWTIPIQLLERAEVERDAELFWKLPGRGAPVYDATAALRVLCLADSVTVMIGGGGYPELLEPLLDERVAGGATVWNAGVPGYTTHQSLAWLRLHADAPAPHVATVQLAWNDHAPAMNGRPDAAIELPSERVLRLHARLDELGTYRLLRRALGKGRRGEERGERVRVPLETYEQNLRAILATLRERGARVAVLSSPYLSSREDYVPVHRAYNAAAERVAVEAGALFVDVVPDFVDRPELFLAPQHDHVHFDLVGSQRIADRLLAAFESAGWLTTVR